MVGVLAVAIQAAIGIPLGLIAGYRGGRVDTLITRAADIQLSLSTLMMAIIALALFRTALGGEALGHFAVPLLVLVIGIAEWPYLARTARAATQVEASKDYVRAARALGASDAAIVRRHILPNIASPLIVVPPLLVYALAVLPALSDVLPAVASPTLTGVAGLLGTPLGAAAGWAHFIGFDLFVGRWIFLDARERGFPHLITAPVLVLTILLGPLGMLAHLLVRAVRQRSGVGAPS